MRRFGYFRLAGKGPTLISLLLLLDWLPSIAHADGSIKCPPPEEIMPCRCRGWNNQIQVWCSHSDLERVNGALEHLMKLKTMPAIDELIVENNRMPALPARAFGALRIGRLLLRNNGLESISRNAFAGLEDFIEELYIVESKLTDFPFDSIENLKNLEAFTLEKSKIRLLPKFGGLNRLKHIRIDGSLISSLPIGAFSKMGSIKQIHLVNSNLGRIAEGIFGPLDTLMLANFSGNQIDSIQRRSFALLPKLEVLSLANNKLEDPISIGRAVEALASLKSLDVSYNQLKTLPEGSFVNLKTLQMLSLVSNQIQNVNPRSFTHLPALRKVDLSDNALRNFPRHFFESTPLLEELRLRKNLLSTPGEISELLNSLLSIRFLDLGENGITSLQSGTFTNHTQLQRLDLSDNVISSIGLNSFINVPTLMEMSLRNNSLTSLQPPTPNGALWNIPSLVELDLSYNKLQAMDSTTFDGLDQLTRIDLSFNSLKSLRTGSFSLNKNIEHLDLMGNGLNHLAGDAFVGLKKLNKLDLSRNHLELLSGDLFMNMRHLQYLNLGNNRLNNLPSNLFSNLVGLEELNLKSNLLGNILPQTIFNRLENLKELNLKHNSLADLGSGLFKGLKSLEILKLGTNQIINLNDELFSDTNMLKSIDLNSNRVKELGRKALSNLPELERFEARENRINLIEPDAFSRSTKLQVIDLAHNSLMKIPDMIRKISSLKVLDLSHNQIDQIGLTSDVFKHLTNLMELYLNDNRIVELNPHVFNNLESLTIVDLDGNELNEIKPDTFYNLPRLIYLRISRNKIKRINNKAFSNLNSLDGLDLQENELESIGESSFEKTGSLKYLNLSHNNFDSMNRMGLFTLQSLEVLDMSFNRLSEVDEKSLRHLKWLVELRISDNGICRLPVGVFDGMSRLKMLILKNNFLSHIYESVFFKLKNNIAFIDISGNPISCDCELIWLRTLMTRETIQELTDSTCETPNDLKGLPIKNVRPGRMLCSSNDNNNVLRQSRARAFGDEECPILSTSKRKPRPELSQSRNRERPLFGSNPSASSNTKSVFAPESGEYVAATTNDLKNRRKNEKLIESDDYVAGDTPTIYAGSSTTTSAKKTSSSQSGIKSTSSSALSNLGNLLGISLPELDFGLNLGLSPSVSLNNKNQYGDDEDDATQTTNTFSTNAILPRPDPLPSSWLNRPSKIDENVDDDQDGDDDDDDTIPNIYEPPEYIPRKPAQPYIPLNPFAESNNRANVIPSSQQKNNMKNTARGPLGILNSFFSNSNTNTRDQQQSRPVRFPSSGSSGPTNGGDSKNWHPSYPHTETGFIPIEPFFHSKANNNYKTGNESSGVSSSSKNRYEFGLSTTVRPKSHIGNKAPLLSSSTIQPYVVNRNVIDGLKNPIQGQDSSSNEQNYAPVDIKNVHQLHDKRPSNDEQPESNNDGDEDNDDLPDFWSMFTTGNDKNRQNSTSSTGTSNSFKKAEGIGSTDNDNTIPFNFSAPIDTTSYLDTASKPHNLPPANNILSDIVNEHNLVSASNPILNDGSNSKTTTSFTSSNNFTSSSTTVLTGNGRRPSGKSTVTKIAQGSTSSTTRGGNDKSLSSNTINTSAHDDQLLGSTIAGPGYGSVNVTRPRSRSGGRAAHIPPVIIGGGDRIEEPVDWYYTNYNTNQRAAGEELEKYLERSRVNQVDDVLVDISQPMSKNSASSSASSLFFTFKPKTSSELYCNYVYNFINSVLSMSVLAYSYQMILTR